MKIEKIVPVFFFLASITLFLISLRFFIDANYFNAMLFTYFSLYPALAGIYLTSSSKKFESSIAYVLLIPAYIIVFLGSLYLCAFGFLYGVGLPIAHFFYSYPVPPQSFLFLFIFITTLIILAAVIIKKYE